MALQQSEGGKSEVQIEVISKTASEVIQLCEECGIDPSLAICGVQISWSGAVEDRPKQNGSTLLVPVVNQENVNAGKLLSKASSAGNVPTVGRYVMGKDDALTMTLENESIASEERLWFASPNLRIRASLLKQSDGFSVASFCTEIRLGVKPPATTDAAA